MQILRVELENVKSHEHTAVEFESGVNAIVGHNGAGKSTIVEAIGFVLFDALGYRQEEFIRAGSKTAQASVTFVSDLDERRYVAVRRIGSSAVYYINDPELGERLADGKADVQRWLRPHLGLEPGTNLEELFKDAVGVPQGTLTASFLLSAANRKRIFDALLQVEDYRRASDRLLAPANLLKERKQEVAVEIASMTARLERLPTLRESLATRKEQLRRLHDELATATKELARVQDTYRRLDAVRDELVALERSAAQVRERRHGLAAQRITAEQAVADAKEAQAVVGANMDGFLRYEEAQKTQADLDAQVRVRQRLEAQRSAAQTGLAGDEAEIRHLDDELAAIAEADALVESLRPSVREQEELEKALAAAQLKQAQLDSARRSQGEQQATVTRLSKRLVELESQIERATALRAEQSSVDQAIVQSQAQVEAQREEMQLFKSRADLLKVQTKRLEDTATATCPVCEQPLTPAHREDLLSRNTGMLEDLREQYRTAQELVKEHTSRLQAQQDRAKQLQAGLLKLARPDEVDEARSELARAQASLENTTAQVAEVADAAGRLAGLQAEIDKLGDPRGRSRVAAARARQAEETRSKLEKLRRQVAGDRAKLAGITGELAAFVNLDARLDEVAGTLKQCQAAYQAVVEHRRQAHALATRESELTALFELEAAVAAELATAERLQAEAAAKFDAEAYASAAAGEQELRQQVGSLRARQSMLADDQAREEQEIGVLQELSKALKTVQDRRAALEVEEEALDVIRSFLRRAGPYITQALTRQISEGARQIFSDLMQDYSRHLAWTDDYGITLEVDGHERQFSQLSGGEQMSAALAVRLALLREMSGIDVAFFDEPTTNLDESRREALARQILQVRGFRQLFVISHDDTFEQATQNLVRVERLNGVSSVSYG